MIQNPLGSMYCSFITKATLYTTIIIKKGITDMNKTIAFKTFYYPVILSYRYSTHSGRLHEPLNHISNRLMEVFVPPDGRRNGYRQLKC